MSDIQHNRQQTLANTVKISAIPPLLILNKSILQNRNEPTDQLKSRQAY